MVQEPGFKAKFISLQTYALKCCVLIKYFKCVLLKETYPLIPKNPFWQNSKYTEMVVCVNGYTLLIDYHLLKDLLFNSCLLTNQLNFSYAHIGVRHLKRFTWNVSCLLQVAVGNLGYLWHFAWKSWSRYILSPQLHRILIRVRMQAAIH